MYLAQQKYDEQEKNYSNADGQDDYPQRYSSWFLYLNVRECTGGRLQKLQHYDIIVSEYLWRRWKGFLIPETLSFASFHYFLKLTFWAYSHRLMGSSEISSCWSCQFAHCRRGQIKLQCRLFILPATAMTIDDKHSGRRDTVQHYVLGLLEKCPKVTIQITAVIDGSAWRCTVQVGTQCMANDPPLKSWSERQVWKFSLCFKGFCDSTSLIIRLCLTDWHYTKWGSARNCSTVSEIPELPLPSIINNLGQCDNTCSVMKKKKTVTISYM